MTLSRDGLSLPKPQRLKLKKMIFSKKTPSFDYFSLDCHGIGCTSKDKDNGIKIIKRNDGILEYEFGSQWNMLTDFQIEFFKTKLFGGKSRVMSFWLHTQFVDPLLELHLSKKDIDKVSKNKDCPEFTIDVYFEYVTPLPIQAQEAKVKEQEELKNYINMMMEGRKMTRLSTQLIDNVSTILKQDVLLFLRDDNAPNKTSLPQSLITPLPQWTLYYNILSNVNSMHHYSITDSDEDTLVLGKELGECVNEKGRIRE